MALKVLWNSDKPLSASEIAERIPNREWPAASIQSILRSLEKKKAIEVAEITKLGKSYGRLFRPAISANDYVAMQFQRHYQADSGDQLSFISSLLGQNKNKKDVVTALRELLKEYEEE